MVSIQRVLSQNLEIPWLYQTCLLGDCIPSYIQLSTKAFISFNTVFQINRASAVVQMLAWCDKVTSSKCFNSKNINRKKH